MARVTIKSRKRFRLDLNEKEMNTLTIALALLDVLTMEEELREQGVEYDKAEYDHLSLFKVLTDITGLYPQAQLADEPREVETT